MRGTSLPIEIINAPRMLDVARHIEEAVRSISNDAHPRLIWWVQGLDDLRSRAGNVVDAPDRAAVQRALAARGDGGNALLLSSKETISGAVLLLRTPAPPALREWVTQARPYVDNALEKSQLRACVDRLARAEKLQ